MSLTRDFRYALRIAMRRKDRTFAVVAMMVIGISAKVTIFALMNSAIASCAIPARRATRLDRIAALRDE